MNLFGAVAQLEERLICIQEVVGSIPSGSTLFRGVGVWIETNIINNTPNAPIAQLVERIHGKDEVISSNLIGSSIL